MVSRGLYSYWQRVHIITLLWNFFSYCFCMLSEFAKIFERKVWRTQVPHLDNAACALSSLNRCFQLSTNLDKDFFHYLWYCKKQIKCGISWHWWNSTDVGLIDMTVCNQSGCRNFCMFILFRKSHHKSNLESSYKYGFKHSEHAHASYPGLSLCLPGFSPYRGAGRKESSGTGLILVVS